MNNYINNSAVALPDFKNYQISVASPGRINLIGEHTDYNKGFVMPAAIDKKIFFELRENGLKGTCNIYSETYDSGFSFELDKIIKSDSSWQNYILGVINEIQQKGKQLKGFDCLIRSELPIGAGISSSAALECGLAAGVNELFALNLSKEEIVYLAQAAENNFVGSQCGIMDQYASVMSKKGYFILLDCLSLEAQYIQADLGKTCLLLINTKVSHSLAESEYNTRRQECEEALTSFQKKFQNVKTLRDINLEMLEEIKTNLNGKQYNRVLYVLQENQRVIQASQYLQAGELKLFGKLMYDTHYGLRDLYEVSCEELDFLVNFSENKEFIYGSRMMGGGFGGCTINLIEEDKITEFEKEVSVAYKHQFGVAPEFISVAPGEGTIVQRAK